MLSRNRRSAPTGCGSSRISTIGSERIARSRAVSVRNEPPVDASLITSVGIASMSSACGFLRAGFLTGRFFAGFLGAAFAAAFFGFSFAAFVGFGFAFAVAF